jgi:competence protein ComEA
MPPGPPFVLPPERWPDRLRGLLAGLGLQGRALALVALAALSLAGVVWLRAAPRPEPFDPPGGTAGLPRLTSGPPASAAGGAEGAAGPAPAAGPVGATGAGGPSGVAGAPGAALAVHVAGRVRRPGLRDLPAGSRVADAIEAAGGAAPGADLDRLNLARRLTDGEQVLVPARGEPLPAGAADPAAGAGGGAPAGPVDLNTATAEQLEALPGVGEVTAERIIAYRTRHPFRSVADLRQVEGIGERRMELLADLVTVG